MKITMLAASTVLALGLTGPALARDARCYTSDDGDYACQFVALDKAGSFEISASGKPTFQLWVDAPGVGSASAIFAPGGRAVALPGPYRRSARDGACWVSDATDTEICAW